MRADGDGRLEPRAGEPWLIWFSAVSWDAIRGTDWHLATAMTEHARILWVDPPVSPLTSSVRQHRRDAGMRSVGPLTPRLAEAGHRITRLTPVALPGLTRPGVRLTTTAFVRVQVRWAVRKIGFQPFAAVATHLENVLSHWGRGVVNLLHATDDYVAGAELMGLSASRLRRQERQAVGRADVVSVVSPGLAEHWSDLGASPVVIPNGCLAAIEWSGDIPSPARELGRPVVGLVGQLSERIDMDVLETIVDGGFSLLLVGPHDTRWERERFMALTARPGVHYAGRVPAEAVPSYLAAIDVGVTPYQDSAFNRASFPLKTLEYLAAGLPVVSSDLPSARWLRDSGGATDRMLAIAASKDEFVEAIRRLAKERQDGDAMACRALASQHSWSRRADALAASIGLTG
jgi:teichuronic acid biosynthesis glycosyltransferase TuaH